MGKFVLGVDVPSVTKEKNIDWVKVRRAGYTFAILRAYGIHVDVATYQRNLDAARKAGLIVGAYMYLYPASLMGAPQAQVAAFRKQAGALGRGFLLPALDIEYSTKKGSALSGRASWGITAAQGWSHILQAQAAIDDMYGRSQDYTSARVILDDLSNLPVEKARPAQPPLNVPLKYHPLWLADYTRALPLVPPHWQGIDRPDIVWRGLRYSRRNFWIHQCEGDRLGIPGMVGSADVNRFYLMEPGEIGERVKLVQHLLGLDETGVYDEAMRKAVAAYQRSQSLSDDAVIGPATASYLWWEHR